MSTEIGVKKSFYQLITDDNFKIEIPIIQRDYVQGRDNAKDVRENFLQVLKLHLLENNPINLDFIYGSIIGDKFIPLDGQQRLTTLFLLHWYLAKKDANSAELLKYIEGGKSKFTYETRISSREFCNALLSHPLVFEDEELVSELLRDQPWYYLSWEQDPTIKAMLNTLDSIHNEFAATKGLYERLTNKNPVINFQFIKLEDFGLTDQLYIKMNSRGKPLTEFENLKAKTEQILGEYDQEYSAWFSEKVDSEWTDFFWEYRDEDSNLFDQQVINCLHCLIANQAALQKERDLNKLKKFLDSRQFDFYQLKHLGADNFEIIYPSLLQIDAWITYFKEVNHILHTQDILSSKDLFFDTLKNSLSYSQRLQVHALLQFLVIHKSIDGLADWMRVIRNLTENTRIEEIQQYYDTLDVVDKMLQHSINILAYMVEAKGLQRFNQEQVKEEKIKAHLLVQNPTAWRTRILSIENHYYFNGQIGFLLDFSGIEQVYDVDSQLSWSDKEEQHCLNAFDAYAAKVQEIFNKDGINQFDQFLLERALLSMGDYLLSKGRNRSFLIDKDRDISWKRLLRDKSDQRDVFKQLLQKLVVGETEKSLHEIIRSSKVEDWRKYFVQFPELIQVCGKERLIRHNDENDILLLEKSRMNGMHREYYSFALCCRLTNMENKVEFFPAKSTEYYSHIDSINQLPIDIHYGFNEEHNAYGYLIKWKKEKYFIKEQEGVIELLAECSIIKVK
jgi:hypothetical protein